MKKIEKSYCSRSEATRTMALENFSPPAGGSKHKAFTLIELPVVRKRAFTLIELLIVIAIIGILSTIITISYVGAKERARDATRKSDLNQIKSVLAIYFADQNPNSYVVQTSPVTADANSTGLSTDYIKTFPTDPIEANPYKYQTDSDGQNYVLSCNLENDNDSDRETTAPTGFTLPTGYDFYMENN